MAGAALYTSGLFFALGTLAHAVRLMTGLEIVIGGVVVPLWVSFPGALIAAALAAWMLAAARRA